MKFKHGWFKNKDYKKIIWYKNPKECSSFKIERVNPDHVGIIWGYRKKSSKGRNWIKIGKVYFSIIPVAYGLMVAGYIDAFTNYAYMILGSISLLSLAVYMVIPFLVYAPVLGVRSIKKWAIGGKF